MGLITAYNAKSCRVDGRSSDEPLQGYHPCSHNPSLEQLQFQQDKMVNDNNLMAINYRRKILLLLILSLVLF